MQIPVRPLRPVQVLIVCDGYQTHPFSFSSAVDPSDHFFTLTTFVNALRSVKILPFEPAFEISLAHLADDIGFELPDGGTSPLLPRTTVNAWFTWHGQQPPPQPAAGAPPPYNPVELSDFDVVYLFGFETTTGDTPASTMNLCWDGGPMEDQLWAFVQFMQAGGGLFATGDHEDLGARLCGSIPRVRSMRRWWWDYSPANTGAPGEPGDPAQQNELTEEGPYETYGASFVFGLAVPHPFNRSPYDQLRDFCAPPALGLYRLDTLRPGPSGLEDVADANAEETVLGIPFDRQSDVIPQPLYPRANVPLHPVLAQPRGGRLGYLPDHMHEGLVIGEGDADGYGYTGGDSMITTEQYTYYRGGDPVQEFPAVAGNRPLPQIIAQVKGSGEHATPSSETQHVGALDPSRMTMLRGAISAYDGSLVDVGRVITQTSFHHFVDINLTGDPLTFGNPNPSLRRTGLNSAMMAELLTYWINLTLWLAPTETRAQHMMVVWGQAAKDPGIRMVARPEMAGNGYAVHDIGMMAVHSIDARIPAPLLHDLAASTMDPEHAGTIRPTITALRRTVPQFADEVHRTFLHGFLGGGVLHLLGSPDRTQDRPAVVQAGLRGAHRSLSVSRHAPIVRNLRDALATWSRPEASDRS